MYRCIHLHVYALLLSPITTQFPFHVPFYFPFDSPLLGSISCNLRAKTGLASGAAQGGKDDTRLFSRYATIRVMEEVWGVGFSDSVLQLLQLAVRVAAVIYARGRRPTDRNQQKAC